MFGLAAVFIYFFMNTREVSRHKKNNDNESEIPTQMELDAM